MTLKALIFDVDGTLAETEEAHRQAFNESFAARGLDWHWDREDYRRLLATTGGKERMRAFQADLPEGARRLTGDEIAALHAEKTARYGDILASGGLALRPGIAELVELAREAELCLAVATTTNRPNVEALTRCCWGKPAEQVFDVIAAGDEVAAKKPAPDVYRLALARLALPPRNCIAFEDSHNGLMSAMGAGLPVIVTPSAYTEGEDFTGAAYRLASLEREHWPLNLQAKLLSH
ncbi:haloacid dehalogenase superfamily, subfamily IA, variant 3 with third motif having DD or ED [Rhodovulum sp. ES.010]|uniref:HAD family hydrolase n=1 Tax=Rhodovulum sp. ES.010 TaxID=1882821 RepID=UPI00092B02D0|nr:HAD family hydrolase [Rhodovulum sp. ES.010]SIO27387.1 haloacid dehalogenase superfamily, subfamily IA, variant 3 with third motif having DD or ED [Rhodovulum sp. ES.010]